MTLTFPGIDLSPNALAKRQRAEEVTQTLRFKQGVLKEATKNGMRDDDPRVLTYRSLIALDVVELTVIEAEITTATPEGKRNARNHN